MMGRRWVPWLGFLCVVVACVVFSVVAGVWIVRVTDPEQVGRSAIGSWAELGDQGFRVRLDDVAMAPSFPSAYDPTTELTAPEGFQYLRVRMTVESLVGPDDAMGCLLTLRNSEGEGLGNPEYGVDGPSASECNALAAVEEGGQPIGQGDKFSAQSVFIVLPDELDSFTLDVVPLFVDDEVFWTFDLD